MNYRKIVSITIFIISQVVINFSLAHSQGTNNTNQFLIKADSLFDLKDYNNALKWYKLSLANLLEVNPEPDTAYANLCFSIAETHMNLGNYDSSLNYLQRDLNIEIKIRGEQHPYVATVFSDLGVSYFNLHQNEKALSCLEKCLDLRLKILEKAHPHILLAYLNLADVHSSIGNPMLAIKYYKSAAEVEFEMSKKETSKCADINNLIGVQYDNLGEYKNAIEYYQKALKSRIDIFGEENIDVATTYNNIGIALSKLALYSDASNNLEKSLGIKETLLKRNDPRLADSYNSIGYLYDIKGENEKAISFYEKALKINTVNFGEMSPEISIQLSNLGSAYIESENFQKAIEYSEKALAIKISNYGYYNSSTAILFNNLGLCYSSIGDYEKAIENYQKALEIKLKVLEPDNPSIATAYFNLASRYIDKEDYNAAINFLEKTLDIRLKKFGENHPDVSETYRLLANAYNELGDFKKAFDYGNKALTINIRVFGSNDIRIANSYNILALILNHEGLNSSAIDYYKKSLPILKANYGGKNARTAETLGSIGLSYQEMGDYERAGYYLKKALEIQMKISKTENSSLANIYFLIGYLVYRLGDYKGAEYWYNRAVPIYNSSNNPILNELYGNCILNYTMLQDNESLESIFYKYSNGISNEILLQKSYLNENALDKYINRNLRLSAVFAAVLSSFELHSSPITDALFSISMSTKGILWNQSKKIREEVYASSDSSVKGKYLQWVGLQKSINIQSEKGNSIGSKNEINLDSLINSANELQFNLFRNLNLSSEPENVQWKDIQKFISYNDAIVDIIRVEDYLLQVDGLPKFIDSVRYVALIVTKETPQYPEIVVLPKGEEMEGLWFQNYLSHTSGTNKLQTDYSSFEAYWKPIAEKLKDKKHIYFCPDGIYNKINLNVLFNTADGAYLGDERDIQLVTNIKEVLKLKQDTAQKFISKNMNAVVIGNPKFNLSANDTLLFASNTRSLYDEDVSVSAIDTLTRGLNISQLPGTELEVNYISTTLKNYGWNVSTYTGPNATEEVIKSLRSPNILHIATHGYFLEDNTANKNINGLQLLGQSNSGYHNNPLLRSGLLFSGAQNTFNGNKSENRDNGVLTSQEAMSLFLDSTDLVVLSACETAGGDVKNGEGVYGLQRAFRVAGAHSILMSMWKVDDEATKELMTDFYKNWIEDGMNKHEAFKAAQLQLRKIPKYNHPYYWGAFVMVGE